METRKFDVLIVGGGVAGMTAGVYAKRRGKKVAIIEMFSLGGQVNTIEKIENFPSQSQIDGISLCRMFEKQVEHLEIEVIHDEVLSAELVGKTKTLVGRKATYQSESVVIASGLSYVKLGIGEDKFLGNGVSFCAVCDAFFHRGEHVCVASKRGSGLKGATELAQVCEKVTVFDSDDMTTFAKANKNSKIEVVSKANIVELLGKDMLEQIVVSVNGKKQVFNTKALFVELGKTPSSALFEGLKRDEKGFIVTDEKMCTSVDGVFAVGDVRSKELRQIVTACADGAIAGQNC